ncbi:MAG: VPLPA-CTERM sorting domain-containing protein [Rhodobacteraceae bacterium]|nr:VPLPA-CTERM sorting domain-containing protein [Paracoccaceae bacterium]
MVRVLYLLFFGVACSLAAPVQAAVVSFTFDAGQVVSKAGPNVRSNMAFFADFLIGETVFVTITVDDETPDRRASPFAGRYVDRVTGGATIRGASSGTGFSVTNGIEIELDQPNEIDFTSPRPRLSDINRSTILFNEPGGGDIDILTRFFVPITLNPNRLPAVIRGFTRKVTPGPDFRFDRVQRARDSLSEVIFFTRNGPRSGLVFGPVPGRQPAPVPVPAGLPLLGGGLIVLAALRARRRRAAA